MRKLVTVQKTMKDIIKEFENRFIYWVVLGSTLNDGSEMRWSRENQQPKEIIDFLSEAISQTQKEAYEKGRLETIKEIVDLIDKWDCSDIVRGDDVWINKEALLKAVKSILNQLKEIIDLKL
jgi:hypothetical protein